MLVFRCAETARSQWALEQMRTPLRLILHLAVAVYPEKLSPRKNFAGKAISPFMELDAPGGRKGANGSLEYELGYRNPRQQQSRQVAAGVEDQSE